MSLIVVERVNHLDTFAARAHENVMEANFDLGQRMGDSARELVAVDTGELLDSIAVDRVDEGTTVVSAGTDHAEPNEFGTRYMPAHPFMLPAFDRHVQEADEVFGKAVREAANG